MVAKRKLTPKDVGRLIKVFIPTNKRANWRFITRYNEKTKRFYAKVPKLGLLLKDLTKGRSKDFGQEKILPKESFVYARRKK